MARMRMAWRGDVDEDLGRSNPNPSSIPSHHPCQHSHHDLHSPLPATPPGSSLNIILSYHGAPWNNRPKSLLPPHLSHRQSDRFRRDDRFRTQEHHSSNGTHLRRPGVSRSRHAAGASCCGSTRACNRAQRAAWICPRPCCCVC